MDWSTESWITRKRQIHNCRLQCHRSIEERIQFSVCLGVQFKVASSIKSLQAVSKIVANMLFAAHNDGYLQPELQVLQSWRPPLRYLVRILPLRGGPQIKFQLQ
jgi:hypothetical protein